MPSPITVPKSHADNLLAQMQQVAPQDAPMPPQSQPIPQDAPEAPSAPESPPEEAQEPETQPSKSEDDSGNGLTITFQSKEMKEIKQVVTELQSAVNEIRNKPEAEAKEPDFSSILSAIKDLSDKIDTQENPEKPTPYDDTAIIGAIKKLEAKIIALSQIVMPEQKEEKKEEDSETAERDDEGRIKKIITKKGGKTVVKEITRDALGKIIK